jgi:hypothetical protein
MSRYTQEQAAELVVQARHQSSEHYRFGQALWNIMSNSVALRATATEADFFYEKRDEVVIKKFYKHFVIGGDEDE